jgi:hypothetical protein
MLSALIVVFVFAYLAIALEHPIKINKSGSALVSAGLLWTIYAMSVGNPELVGEQLRESLTGTAQIVFFLMGAMTIVEVVDAHNGFDVITTRITTNKLSTLMWLVGSTYCERHKRAQRRHGHPAQDGITVHELQPFRDRVAVRRAKNPTNSTWDILRQRWAAVASNAESVLKAHAEGKPGSAHTTQAAHHIKQLSALVPDALVMETTLAMFLMRESQPHRFRSDRAFDFQLSRRVRALSDVNAGTYFDHETGKVKRVYRDVLPGTLIALAEPLKAAFGVAGLYLAELDQRDEKNTAAKKMELMTALKEMV